MSDFHTLKVSKIDKNTPNSVIITFAVPGNLMRDFAFKAGQYLTIKHTIEGKEVRRAYSICSAPHDKVLQVGVKKVDGGAFSVYANESLKDGDTLEVMPPQGKFIVNPEKDNAKNYAAFAAGSGITPILSIIEAVMEDEPDSKFLLVYGNQTRENTMFYDAIMKLKQKNPQRFFPNFIYSRSREDNARFGRIDRSIVNYYLKNEFEYTVFDAFYVCGPEPMIDEVSSTLKENGINEKAIHFELFKTSEGGLLVESHDGTTNISIIIDDETTTFNMSQEKSVLDAALEKKLDAPYSCQGGICSTCIARIVEGKAEMRKNQILTDGEIAEGLILTCQAHPTTATLTVDYDDV
ncbi:flavodoxin reductase [Patiriisocius marinistellae]|uniref:Flavodoxin reductase n=1 Tax=Patiriisocius marinistellae TaxID=2494560 RepID=A0A5J4FSB2_9FLAO|nr:ferredoxin--NADP reductase [Patiriisocius marinistellae]GEQ84837.1 flavodoxin reductase [Patiriisocius marinistellae]